MAIVRLDPFNFFNRSILRPTYENTPDFEWPHMQMVEGIDLAEDEKGENLIAKVALPGVSNENVSVTFEDGVLHVSGHEKEKEEDKKKKKIVYRRERVTSFDYTCTLPRPINPDKIVAEMENGVLTIVAPIAAEAKSKSIPVRVKQG